MKTLLASLIFLITSASMAAPQVLAQFNSHPGFMPKPLYQSLNILTDGTVVRETSNLDGTGTTTEKVAQISARAVKNLQDMIKNIDVNSALIDNDANKPRCLDAPSNSITVTKGNTKLVTYSWASCHTSTLANGESDELNQIILSFERLSE